MKKTYIHPKTTVITTVLAEMVSATGVRGQGTDMGYKGADEDGSVDPDVKEEEDFFEMLIEQEFVDKHSLW